MVLAQGMLVVWEHFHSIPSVAIVWKCFWIEHEIQYTKAMLSAVMSNKLVCFEDSLHVDSFGSFWIEHDIQHFISREHYMESMLSAEE
jgi:hypothetical protein